MATIASTWKRAVALLIDLALAKTIGGFIWQHTPGSHQNLRAGYLNWSVPELVPVLFLLLLSILFLKFLSATPGKLICGIRVAPNESNETRLSWTQAFLRSTGLFLLFYFFSVLPYSIAFLRSDRRQPLDLMANTAVVQRAPQSSTFGKQWLPALAVTAIGIAHIVLNISSYLKK